MKTKKMIGFILAIALVFSACSSAPTSELSSEENSLASNYSYFGETDMELDGRSFLLEDIPESVPEEIVVLDFYFTITGDFDMKHIILAPIESHLISINAEQERFDDGLYIKSYTIHNIETLTEEQYANPENADGTTNLLYYSTVAAHVEEFALTDYSVVCIVFSMELSDEALAAGPQYGEGTFQRCYLVGKTAEDDTFKIYDFGMMQFPPE